MTETPISTAISDSTALVLSDPDKLIAQLEPQIQEQARQLAGGLADDENQILGLGAQAQRGLSQLSTRFTDDMKVKDTSVVGEALTELLDQVNSLDPNSLTSYSQMFLTRLPGGKWAFGWLDQVIRFKRKYDTINTRVGQIAEKLRAESNSMQDGASSMKLQARDCRDYRLGLLRDMTAGYYKKQELEAKRAQLQALPDQNESVSEQIRRLTVFINILDRKVGDLITNQLAAYQVALMMDTVWEGDIGLLSQLQTATRTTIPMWRFMAGVALGLSQQQLARKLMDAVRDTNNRIVTSLSGLYRQETLATAHALEKPSIDQEALKKANLDLVTTASDILEIQRQGSTDRQKLMTDVVQMTTELRVSMRRTRIED